jgi:RNA-binding protein YhbY
MKTLLDKYLECNYKEVEKYTSYFIKRSKLKLSVQTVISNAYVRYLNINPDVKHDYEAKGYLFHLIKTEIIWRDTESKKELTNAIEDYLQKEEPDDFLIKLEHEFKLQNQRVAIEIYRKTQKDRVKKIFFETYFDKGYNTVRSIAKHFNISEFSSHGLITEMKQDIRQILEKHELN